MTRDRLAPRAIRTDTSRVRASARARNILATLAMAMSRTSDTAPMSVHSVPLTLWTVALAHALLDVSVHGHLDVEVELLFHLLVEGRFEDTADEPVGQADQRGTDGAATTRHVRSTAGRVSDRVLAHVLHSPRSEDAVVAEGADAERLGEERIERAVGERLQFYRPRPSKRGSPQHPVCRGNFDDDTPAVKISHS